MSSKEDTHFTEYREQTRIKHSILSNYLKPYFVIRASGQHPNLVYIDGFAGCGEYMADDGPQPGSPLRALQLFSELPFKDRISTLFIECNEKYYDQLSGHIKAFAAATKGMREPAVLRGTFDDTMQKLLAGMSAKQAKLAPSFLFADPCRVDGLSYATLSNYLNETGGEVLIFFNYDGVTRIAGLGAVPDGTLAQLLGSNERAQYLVAKIAGLSPKDREEAIVQYYTNAFAVPGQELYSTAFRVEYESKRSTSHYLIHLTTNKTSFRMMKEIMWPLGETAEGKGALALEQKSLVGSQPLFRPQRDAIKSSVLDQLREIPGHRVALDYFYTYLSEQRGNSLCRPAYKDAIMELENEGRVVILDQRGVPAPPNKRIRKNVVTLGETKVVALPATTEESS